MCNLSELKENETAKLIGYNNISKTLRKRLLDMGLTKGVDVIVKKISPLGDPISILVRGYQLCMRKTDLKEILVDKY